MKITIEYIAHNGSSLLLKEDIDFLLGIGTTIENPSLKNSGCTGLFMITKSSCIKQNDNSYICTIEALEVTKEVYKRNLEEFVRELTTG